MLLIGSNGCRPSSESVTSAVTNKGCENLSALVLKSLGCIKIIPGVCGGKGKSEQKALAVAGAVWDSDVLDINLLKPTGYVMHQQV